MSHRPPVCCVCSEPLTMMFSKCLPVRDYRPVTGAEFHGILCWVSLVPQTLAGFLLLLSFLVPPCPLHTDVSVKFVGREHLLC